MIILELNSGKRSIRAHASPSPVKCFLCFYLTKEDEFYDFNPVAILLIPSKVLLENPKLLQIERLIEESGKIIIQVKKLIFTFQGDPLFRAGRLSEFKNIYERPANCEP